MLAKSISITRFVTWYLPRIRIAQGNFLSADVLEAFFQFLINPHYLILSGVDAAGEGAVVEDILRVVFDPEDAAFHHACWIAGDRAAGLDVMEAGDRRIDADDRAFGEFHILEHGHAMSEPALVADPHEPAAVKKIAVGIEDRVGVGTADGHVIAEKAVGSNDDFAAAFEKFDGKSGARNGPLADDDAAVIGPAIGEPDDDRARKGLAFADELDAVAIAEDDHLALPRQIHEFIALAADHRFAVGTLQQKSFEKIHGLSDSILYHNLHLFRTLAAPVVTAAEDARGVAGVDCAGDGSGGRRHHRPHADD